MRSPILYLSEMLSAVVTEKASEDIFCSFTNKITCIRIY